MIIDTDSLSSSDLYHLAGARQMWEERKLAQLRVLADDLLEVFGLDYLLAITDVVELRCGRIGLDYRLAAREVLRPISGSTLKPLPSLAVAA